MLRKNRRQVSPNAVVLETPTKSRPEARVAVDSA